MCKEDAVDTVSEISYNPSHEYNALSLVFLLSSSCCYQAKRLCDTFLSLKNSTLLRHFLLNH